MGVDFLAVGDIVTEPFIRLSDARVACDEHGANCELCLSWGDKIPYESMEVIPAVGNSANAAVAAARLGVRTALATDIGNDAIGTGNIERLAAEGVDTAFVRVHSGMKSNYHYVLWYKDDRTILVKHEAYPYEFPDINPAPQWMYLSSLSEHSEEYHGHIAAYLAAHPETKLAFQPGTFQMKLGTEILKKIYERTAVFFSNVEEAERILSLPPETPVKDLLNGIRALGPAIVVITDGRNGAYSFDGTEYLSMPLYPDPRPPFERTGAGDAFSATVTVALSLGKPLAEALQWGPVNSMSVVQEVGAQKGLLTREALERYVAAAPESYRAEPF